MTSDYFDLEPCPISGHFEIGKEYLALADVVPLEDGEHFFATQECGPTSELKYAHAVLQRVRAEKTATKRSGLWNAAATSDIGAGILEEDYVRPLPGVVVRLQSRGKSFEAKTDKHGAYAFEALPKGTTVFRRTYLSPGGDAVRQRTGGVRTA